MNTTAQQRLDNTVDTILIKYFLEQVVNRIDWSQFATNSTSEEGLFGIKELQTNLLIFVNAGLVLLLIALSAACKYGRRGPRQEGGVTTSTTPTIAKGRQGKPKNIGKPILTSYKSP